MKKSIIAFFMVMYATVFVATGQANIKAVAIKQRQGQYEVRITVQVDEGWHIYSTTIPQGGPVPTAITLKKNPLVTLVGRIKEQGALIEKHEEVFDMKVKYYENEVVFIQKVTLKGKAKTNITGSIEYMLCTNEKCLPPKTETFDVKLE